MDDPDLGLLEAVRRGEESALRALMDRYREPVFRFAWRYVRNEAVAADIVQETFVKVFFKAPSFHPRGTKVSSWIFAIAANLCRDHHRRESRRKILPFFGIRDQTGEERGHGLVDRIEDPTSGTEQILLDRENEDLVADAVNRLPPKLKGAFILFALEGRSQQDCAEVLGISPKTVETRVYRARRHLREHFGDHFSP